MDTARLLAIQFACLDQQSIVAGGLASCTRMVDAAYRDGVKALDESTGQPGVRQMRKDFAISSHTANDAIVKEPPHESVAIFAAAPRQIVRLGWDRFRCWQMPRFIHALFHKV